MSIGYKEKILCHYQIKIVIASEAKARIWLSVAIYINCITSLALVMTVKKLVLMGCKANDNALFSHCEHLKNVKQSAINKIKS